MIKLIITTQTTNDFKASFFVCFLDLTLTLLGNCFILYFYLEFQMLSLIHETFNQNSTYVYLYTPIYFLPCESLEKVTTQWQ